MNEGESAEDQQDPLYRLITSLTTRKVTNTKIFAAMGLSKARFYKAREEGKLIQHIDRIIALANYFEINPLELLLPLVPGLEPRHAVEYVDRQREAAQDFLVSDRGESQRIPPDKRDDVRNDLIESVSDADHRLKKGGKRA